jgi:hypothetical protein
MGDIENIQKVLTDYNSTLQSCIEKISDNNKVNKKMAEEIHNKVNLIKGRVIQARDDVEEIGKQQTLFRNTMNQEKETIQKEQEERMIKSRQDKERLQNELKESQNASATQIQDLQTQQENEIQRMKEKAGKEADDAIRIQKEKDDLELQRQVEELNKKMKEANRVAAEKADTAKKEAEEAKKLADNEKLAQGQKLQELEQQRQAIFEQETACEEQLKKLKANVTDMEGEIEKMKGEIDTLNTRNSEDKKAAAEESQRAIEQLNADHAIEMKTQIEKAGKEKEQYMVEAAASQAIAIQKAVEEVKESNRVQQKQIEEATKATQGNLQAQLEECKKTTEEYTKEVENHMEKYKELEKQFAQSSNDALDGLKELVEKLGIEDIARLEKTIQDILGEKGPDGAGPDEPGKSPLNRMSSTDEALEDADRVLQHQESFKSGEISHSQLVSEIDADAAAAAERKRAKEARQKKKEERHEKRQKRIADTKREQEEFAKTTLKKEPGVSQAWVTIDKTKYSGSHKDHVVTKELLLNDVETFISGINSQEKMTKLINNVIQNHGIHNTRKPKYNKELARFKGGNYEKIRQIYKKALVGIIEGGLKKEIYVEIIDKINETTVEEVFEELLAAFHLVYSTDKIGNVYSMGASGGRTFHDSDYIRNGEVAAYLWKPRGDEWFDGKILKKNGKANDDRKMEHMVATKMHDYVHSHDIKKSASTGQGGGFRHGKRSQKKNKRTLKSKLTAKKYSLKVGKKKKGKRGNKSQKRRKSIKIRI